MLSQRYVSLFCLLAIASALLFHFQNCAPVKPSGSNTSRGSDARLIDDYNKSEIQFVTSEVQLRDEAITAEVTGMCNHSRNGAALKWSLWTSSGEVLTGGESLCG